MYTSNFMGRKIMNLQSNPLMQREGLPKFDQIKAEDFVPAVKAVFTKIEKVLKDVEENSEPTWNSLIEPFDETDLDWEYTWSVLNHLKSVKNSDALRKAYDELMPECISLSLKMSQSKPRYNRLVALRDSIEFNKFNDAKKRIIDSQIRSAEKSGIALEGEKKEETQQKLLAKLNIKKDDGKKAEKKVDTKAMIMESLLVLCSATPQIVGIAQKIKDNHDLLLSEHNSFFDKLKRNLKKAFGIEEKPLYYTVTIVEQTTGAKRTEKINYQTLMSDLATRARRYGSVSQRNSPGYQKIMSMPEEKIAEFVTSQITDCNKLMVLLNALDDFFKAAVNAMNKSKVKGLKIDITTFKNAVLKANQFRAEYNSYIEEEEQMKKLGITG